MVGKMPHSDYIKTVNVDGVEVDIGIDDYGQCYYCQFIGKNGELVDFSCGTYNSDYMGEVEYYIHRYFKESK